MVSGPTQDSSAAGSSSAASTLNGSTAGTSGLSRSSWPSLLPKRNLTLGGRGGAIKKEFKPNLNAKRVTDRNVVTSKDLTVAASRQAQKLRKPVTGGKNARGNNAQRGGVVQDTGIFSEGLATPVMRRAKNETPHYGVECKSMTTRSAVKSTVEEIKSIADDDDDMEQYVDDLHDDEQDCSSYGPEYQMIKLGPRYTTVLVEKKIKAELELAEPKASIKVEAKDEDKLVDFTSKLEDLNVKEKRQLRHDHVHFFADTITELLTGKSGHYILLQIPSILPCSVESDSSKATETDTKDILSQSDKKKHTNAFMNVGNGLIGKIVRYKSGKVRIILAEAHLLARLSMGPGFLWELAVLNPNNDARSSKMMNLGPVEGMLVCTPNWAHLDAAKAEAEALKRYKMKNRIT